MSSPVAVKSPAATNGAGTLIDKINAIVKHYQGSSRWIAYSEQRLTKAGAAIYAQQHGVFTRHSRRAWAYVVGQCPEVTVRRFIVRENLYEEEGIEAQSHYLKLVKMGVAVGLTAQQVEDAVALPTTRAALLIWETLTKDRHWLIGCAAKATLEQGNQPECGLFSLTEGERWMKQLGVSRDDVEFWLMHDEIDRIHGSGAFNLVLENLPKVPHVSELDVLHAVEDSAIAWRMFLDGIADAADMTDSH